MDLATCGTKLASLINMQNPKSQPTPPRRSIPTTILLGDADDIAELKQADCGLNALALGSLPNLSTVAVDPAKHIGIFGAAGIEKKDLLEFLVYQFGVYGGSTIYLDCNKYPVVEAGLKMLVHAADKYFGFYEGPVQYALGSPTPLIAFNGLNSPNNIQGQTLPEAFDAIGQELLNLEFVNDFDSSGAAPTLFVISNLERLIKVVGFEPVMQLFRTARRHLIGIVYTARPDKFKAEQLALIVENTNSLVSFNPAATLEDMGPILKRNSTDMSSVLRSLGSNECVVYAEESLYIQVKVPSLVS